MSKSIENIESRYIDYLIKKEEFRLNNTSQRIKKLNSFFDIFGGDLLLRFQDLTGHSMSGFNLDKAIRRKYSQLSPLQIELIYNAIDTIRDGRTLHELKEMKKNYHRHAQFMEDIYPAIFKWSEDNLVRQMRLFRLEAEYGRYTTFRDHVYSYRYNYRIYGQLWHHKSSTNSFFSFSIYEFDPTDSPKGPRSYTREYKRVPDRMIGKLMKFKKYCVRAGIQEVALRENFLNDTFQAMEFKDSGFREYDWRLHPEEQGW